MNRCRVKERLQFGAIKHLNHGLFSQNLQVFYTSEALLESLGCFIFRFAYYFITLVLEQADHFLQAVMLHSHVFHRLNAMANESIEFSIINLEPCMSTLQTLPNPQWMSSTHDAYVVPKFLVMQVNIHTFEVVFELRIFQDTLHHFVHEDFGAFFTAQLIIEVLRHCFYVCVLRGS